MTTTVKTTAQAVSRKIANLGKGYERFNGDYGFEVRQELGSVIAYNFSYCKDMDFNGFAQDLAEAGYVVRNAEKFKNSQALTVELVIVEGRA